MSCLVCASPFDQALDLGAHPVASFYLPSAEAPESPVRLAIGQCPRCATVQLTRPIPAEALIPPYDWISAREPEEHLDEAVAKLARLEHLSPKSAVVGLTYKDDTTLDRFRHAGFRTVWRVDPADLGVTDPAAGVETVQKLTTAERLEPVAQARGRADLLIVRHIIEHAEDPRAFVQGLAALVRDGGYVMVEAPDCRRSLELGDYTMVWEEHSLYLTPVTLQALLEAGGFEAVSLDVYPFPYENSLVITARKAPVAASPAPPAEEFGRLSGYAAGFDPTTAELRRTLEAARRDLGPIAIFGAGHLACAFVNFHGLADLIDFVADDTPQKQGLFLPGARLPILPSAELAARGVGLCLLAVSPNSEDRIIERNSGFSGQFRSILAASPRSVRTAVQ